MSDGDPCAVVDYLCQHLDINAVDNEGNTPLFEVVCTALESKHDLADNIQHQQLAQFVAHLVDRGADIHHTNHKGRCVTHEIKKLPSALRAVFESYAAQIQQQVLRNAIKGYSTKTSARKM